jgi:hypothetical protein
MSACNAIGGSMRRMLPVCCLLFVLITVFCRAQSSADSLEPGIQRSHPNPFSDGVTFQMTLPSTGDNCRVAVFDVAGQLVQVLRQGRFLGGDFDMYWDGKGSGVPVLPGVYVVIVAVDDRVVDMVKVIKYPLLQ